METWSNRGSDRADRAAGSTSQPKARHPRCSGALRERPWPACLRCSSALRSASVFLFPFGMSLWLPSYKGAQWENVTRPPRKQNCFLSAGLHTRDGQKTQTRQKEIKGKCLCRHTERFFLHPYRERVSNTYCLFIGI